MYSLPPDFLSCCMTAAHMLAGIVNHDPFAIPRADIASPLATATVLITAAVCMNTKKIGTKYLMGLMPFGLINKDVSA